MQQLYAYTYRIYIDAIMKTSEDFLKKIYLSLYLKGCEKVTQGFTVRGSWRPNRTTTYWPPLLWPSALCLSRSPGLLLGACGPSCWMLFSLPHLVSNSSDLQLIWSSTQSGVPRAPSPGWWLSLPRLGSNFSDLQLTGFLSSPSYIIVQSPTQSLEWHVWSSSSGNNCHAVHRSLSSGASVYECTMGFLPCPIFSAKLAYAISSHNCHRNVSLPSGASLWNGMFGRVEGQYTT